MGNARIPGCFGLNTELFPLSRTPGTLGQNDQSDPGIVSRLGDTPGILGIGDWADPNLPLLNSPFTFLRGPFVRSTNGTALSLPSSLCLPLEFLTTQAITKEQLKLIFAGAKLDFLGQVADELNTDLTKFGLDSQLRKAHFFAQVRQEGGSRMEAAVESLNYSSEALRGGDFKYYRSLHPGEADVDGRHVETKAGKMIAHKADQETIANKVYASRNGNGDAASGDGWAFRGRGFIQITGRSNYAAATETYRKLYSGGDVDFEKTPELMAEFPYSIRSAVAFWILHELHKLADRGHADADVNRITAQVNLHTNSYAERCLNFKTSYEAFA